mmetsp:Transcript_35103/g.99904  ORF Transcript_35103/g.99904 Transcript_35103/m.99904 type:complete len:430 (-) Transcript_35103:112-1401(-)
MSRLCHVQLAARRWRHVPRPPLLLQSLCVAVACGPTVAAALRDDGFRGHRLEVTSPAEGADADGPGLWDARGDGDGDSGEGDGPVARAAEWPVISISDLHGDLQHAKVVLRGVGVIDEQDKWSGGSVVLVQTGDVLDRGPDALELEAFLDDLGDQAKAAGGEVIRLLGNHEIMNMCQNLKYVSHHQLQSVGGLMAYKVCLGPFGDPGWRLRRHQTAALLGGERGLGEAVLFVHAGLLPSVARAFVERAAPGPAEAALEEQLLLLSMGRARPRRRRAAMGTFRLDAFVKAPKPRIRRRSVAEGQAAIEALNEEVRTLLAKGPTALMAKTHPLLNNSGPFWTRRFDERDEAGVCRDLKATLDLLGASRMVVGHSVQFDGKIKARCGNRLFLTDTAISRAITGTAQPSALRLGPGGQAEAWYAVGASRRHDL